MQNKIVMIMPYFGKWPEWINLYLYSCSRNEFIDFIFYTDCNIPSKIYCNTIFNKITFPNYCQRVSNALGINFTPENPYKLCDVRPFYGIIHKDIISNYDFWGYGDLDLCYGNLSRWLTPFNLKKYDIFSSHANRNSGHFTLIRNSNKYINACFTFKDWKSKLCSNNVIGLDEYDFTKYNIPNIHWVHRMHRWIGKPIGIGHYTFFSLMIPFFILNKRLFMKELNTSPVPKEDEQWTYDLHSGEMISNKKKAIPYLHFIFFKKTPFLNTKNYWKNGFYDLDDKILSLNSGQIAFNNKKITYNDNNQQITVKKYRITNGPI